MKFNPKNFNPKQVIQDRANLESNWEWATKNDKIDLPKYQKCDPLKPSAGLYNFLKSFRP